MLEDMKEIFPNIGWEALRNKHSAWNRGHFHSVSNQINSVDFDAEIERLFPAPPES
jgi:REP element-mobilizing transposase RayT